MSLVKRILLYTLWALLGVAPLAAQTQVYPAQTLQGPLGYLPLFQYYVNGYPVYGPSKLQDTGTQLLYNGQPIGGGSATLPAANAPGLGLVSVGLPGTTTYKAANPPGSTFYSYASIYEFGDSITVGVGVAGPPYTGGYGPLMVNDFGGNGTNYAVSGATSADESDVIVKSYNPSWTHNPIVTSMIGTNDLAAYGGNTSVFQQDVAGIMEWATVPRNAKIFFTDSQCASTGTWANITTYLFPGGVEQSTTPASTFTCTVVTTGPALYFGYMQDTGWSASSMTILIDGVAPGTGATISGTNPLGIQETYKFTTVRYPLTAGTHTFKVTFAGTSGATGTISPVWLGSSFPISTVSPPTLYIADVPIQQNGANASLVAQYNAALQALINQLTSDGLPIVHVQENAAASGSGGPNGLGWLNTTSDFNAVTIQGGTCAASTSPGLHPNNCGHAHLRDAFEYYMQPVNLPPSAVSLSGNNTWTGSNTFSLLTNFSAGVRSNGSDGTAFDARPAQALMFDGANPGDYGNGGIMGANSFSGTKGLQTTTNRNAGRANTIPFTASQLIAVTSVNSPLYQTFTACASAAAPAVCAAAPAGMVVVAASATTVVVDTTAVSAASEIKLQEDSSLGTALGVTCNTTPATAPPTVSARTAATSFTITTTAPTTNPRCFSYSIVN